MSIVVINPFEVSADDSDAFVDKWDELAEFFRAQPGYMDATLYRTDSATTPFGLVTVARWKSEEDFNAALSQLMSGGGADDGPTSYPATYEVVRSDVPS